MPRRPNSAAQNEAETTALILRCGAGKGELGRKTPAILPAAAHREDRSHERTRDMVPNERHKSGCGLFHKNRLAADGFVRDLGGQPDKQAARAKHLSYVLISPRVAQQVDRQKCEKCRVDSG